MLINSGNAGLTELICQISSGHPMCVCVVTTTFSGTCIRSLLFVICASAVT